MHHRSPLPRQPRLGGHGYFRRVTLTLFALALVGCKTVSIRPERVVSVPPGLTKNQIQIALLGAIINQPVNNLTTRQDMMDRALRATVVGYRRVGADRHPWYYEGEDGDTIIAGFQSRSLYMQIRCLCKPAEVVLMIAKSEGFSQSETHIHENAYKYLEQLVVRIRRSLGEVARAADFGTAPTQSFYGPDGRVLHEASRPGTK